MSRRIKAERIKTGRLIQRDDKDAAPNMQLTPPSLLQPPDPSSRYHISGNQHLQLDPQIQAMALQYAGQQTDPASLRGMLSNVNLGIVPAAGTAAAPAGTTAPLSGGVPAAPAPLVPAGPGPATPRVASAGDLMGAVLAIPTIDTALTTLQTKVTDQVQHEWGQLSKGEKIGAVSAIAVVGAGALAGVLSNPTGRQLALDQLNGRVLPVPGVDWLHLEVNTAHDNLMVGMHVDVGRLLPKSFGFGPSSPNALGGPPMQRAVKGEAEDPVDRAAAGDVTPLVDDVLESGGQPLDRETRAFMEPRFGHDFSQVRVHTDSKAVESAQAVQARAYAVGSDIAFGPGQYAPGTSEGKRLLAHELTHVVQQSGVAARKTVSRDPTPDPEADRVAKLNAAYAADVSAGNWGSAALRLNAYNDTDIAAKLSKLNASQLADMVLGAVQTMTWGSKRVTQPINALNPVAAMAGYEKALQYITKTYGFTGPNFDIKVVPPISGAWATTGGEIKEGAKQTLEIGSDLFQESLAFIVRSIGHEFQHLKQRSQKNPLTNQAEREFLAWAWEALDTSVPAYPLKTAAEHASKALEYYAKMPADRTALYVDKKKALDDLIAKAAAAP